jgi:hypothetical protein
VFHGHDIAAADACCGRTGAGFVRDKAVAVRGLKSAQWSRLMLRRSHYLKFAAGVVVLLAQPALAQAHAPRWYRAGYWHYHDTRGAYRPDISATIYETRHSPFYGPFSGYADTHAAWRYPGWNARHYFGYGSVEPYRYGPDRRSALEGMVEQQASANGIPASLVHRVITRESGYNPHAVSSGNYGLMQIRLGTARAMGYTGSASGLLDPQTNMTYAVRYLAGAYRAAGGNEGRAVALYAHGYNAPRAQQASLDRTSFARSPEVAASLAEERGAAPARRYAYLAPAEVRPVYRFRHYRHHPV